MKRPERTPRLAQVKKTAARALLFTRKRISLRDVAGIICIRVTVEHESGLAPVRVDNVALSNDNMLIPLLLGVLQGAHLFEPPRGDFFENQLPEQLSFSASDQLSSRQGRAGQGRAGQGRQGRAQQGRAGAGQGRAGQGRAGQGRAGQKEINLTVWHEDVALWDILMALRGHSRLKTCPELTVFVIHECGELPQSGKGVRLTWCGLPVQTVLRATSACSCSTSPSDRSGSLRCSEAWIDR